MGSGVFFTSMKNHTRTRFLWLRAFGLLALGLLLIVPLSSQRRDISIVIDKAMAAPS